MSKFVLLFVFIFAFVQLSLAVPARVPRDTENTANDLGKALTDAFGSFVEKLENTFTKENFDKFEGAVKDLGQQFLAKFETKPAESVTEEEST